MTSYAFYNGQFGKKSEINIPLSDRSIFFGDAIYDVAIGCYDRLLWEDEHISRFLCNAKKLGIKHNYSKKKLSSLLREISVKSMLDCCMINFQLSRNLTERRHSAIGAGSNLLVIVEPIKIEKHPSPMKLITMTDKRYGYCDIKTTNLLPAVLSATKAERQGADEAVFIKNGIITECTKSNIAIIKQGRLITPPLSNRILPGITRAHLLNACKKIGIEYEEKSFGKSELFSADEILVTSSTKMCKTVCKIDNFSVGGRARELSKHLQNELYCEFEKCCVL